MYVYYESSLFGMTPYNRPVYTLHLMHYMIIMHNALYDNTNIFCILCTFYGRGGPGWALFGMGSNKYLFIYYNQCIRWSYEYFMHIMYLLWKRWSRVGSLWDGSLGRKVIVRRVHDQLSQLQHQDFQHRCAIFLKILWVLGVFFISTILTKVQNHIIKSYFSVLLVAWKSCSAVGFFKQYPEM